MPVIVHDDGAPRKIEPESHRRALRAWLLDVLIEHDADSADVLARKIEARIEQEIDRALGRDKGGPR